MTLKDIITTDAEIVSGAPVFKGTRVPIQSLFWHLEKGISIDAFLDDFPTVKREQVNSLLEWVGKSFNSKKLVHLYEIAA
jgi:uncharacterized protein (DUF433 family)